MMSDILFAEKLRISSTAVEIVDKRRHPPDLSWLQADISSGDPPPLMEPEDTQLQLLEERNNKRMVTVT